jgi:hypothetical protein
VEFRDAEKGPESANLVRSKKAGDGDGATILCFVAL